jgi:hypothetical protein
MKDFIPENILVYIAVDNSHVVKGMEKINAKAISMLKEIYTSCRQTTLLKDYMKN